MSGIFIDHPQIQMLPDGRRLQMRHGPVDLIVEAFGEKNEIRQAYTQAVQCFACVLGELSAELNILRQPVTETSAQPESPVGRRMYDAVQPFANEHFLTSMIAVAGSVADHVLAAMIKGRNLAKASVNNGGDIALMLSEEESFSIGICADPLSGLTGSRLEISACDRTGGVATSGWRGRSHSLGIADAVTVCAKDAATADTAATLIANAINLEDHPAISRQPACQLFPDSDLGNRLVTTDVGILDREDVSLALTDGRNCASQMMEHGDIQSVHGQLQGQNFTLPDAQEDRFCILTSSFGKVAMTEAASA